MRVSPVMSVAEARSLISQPAEVPATVISTDASLVDSEDGRLVARLVCGAISPAAIDAARRAWGDIDDLEAPSTTRREAAGFVDPEAIRTLRGDIADVLQETPTTARLRLKSGRVLVKPVSNPVKSFPAGYGYQRKGQRACTSRLTSRYPERWESSLPFFAEVGAAFAATLPEVDARHRARCALHPAHVIPGTHLSSVAVNVNYESRYHLDRGDFRDGFSTVSPVGVDEFAGGLLVLPRYGVAFDVPEGAVLFFQAHVDVHGNTPVTSGKRVSFVTYLKHQLARSAKG